MNVHPGFLFIWTVLVGLGAMMLTLSVFVIPDAEAIALSATEEQPWCVADVRHDNVITPEFHVDMSMIKWIDADDPDDGQWGEATYFLDPDLEITTCLVTAPMPTYEWGDIDMDTFGHEMLHCFIGDYHDP